MTPEFNEWWDSEDIAEENPYDLEKPIYWAWEGWQAARKRKWVGLTDGEIAEAVGSPIDAVYLADFRKVEAKLREKNT